MKKKFLLQIKVQLSGKNKIDGTHILSNYSLFKVPTIKDLSNIFLDTTGVVILQDKSVPIC